MELQQIIDAHAADIDEPEAFDPRSSFETIPWRAKELPQEPVTGFFDYEHAYASEKELIRLRRMEAEDYYYDDELDGDEWIINDEEDDITLDFDDDEDLVDISLGGYDYDNQRAQQVAKIRKQSLWAM